ncbi:MAG: hypothetical protein P1Q69_15335 [Candidatus Thorarchaeota archaeon]|nr:hypothetical protein [Candidatus Thorarchaeota archaeon]
MITLEIQNLEIDLIIDFLSNQCSDILSKVWREGDIVAGVFILEDSEKQNLGINITTIVDYGASTEICKVTVHAARTAGVENDATAAEERLRKKLIDFAEENEWTWR